MDRRALLGLVAGVTGTLAGCSVGAFPGATPPTGRTGAPSVAGVTLPVPEDELHRGAPKDAIPAIVDPAFGRDWNGIEVPVRARYGTYTVEPRLGAGDRVIGIERGDEARAYPVKLLDWHEVVNDTLTGPLLVTYCPLCGSGVTARRVVSGEEPVFGVSGLLFRSNLVMYDRATGSLWSQAAATAIRGPATGTTLDPLPSTITTWDTWRADHPDTRVLLPPPESGTVLDHLVDGGVTRDYTMNPYDGYGNSTRIGVGENTFADDRLHPKERVVGVASRGEATAYPLSTLLGERVVNDTVGGLRVVVAVAPDDETLVAYRRRVEGTTLRFAPAGDGHMRGGGSRWSIPVGKAVDGPYDGTTLEPATDVSPMFWFAWRDFHPDTAIYGTTRGRRTG